MANTLTIKGQVTIPKHIRDSLNLTPGCQVDFAVNQHGDLVIHKMGQQAIRKSARTADRFDAVRGKADIKWRTDELMSLLRSDK